jgi:hypothetical protein
VLGVKVSEVHHDCYLQFSRKFCCTTRIVPQPIACVMTGECRSAHNRLSSELVLRSANRKAQPGLAVVVYEVRFVHVSKVS